MDDVTPECWRPVVGAHAKLFVQLGQRIGYGVVIDPEIRITVPGRNGTSRAARLLCDCGDEYVQLISGLVGARVRRLSCGCMTKKLQAESAERARAAQRAAGLPPPNFVNRAGRRYGSLLVIRLVDRRSGHARWLCRCDCGNEVVAQRKSLERDDAAHCGCQRKDPRNKLPSGMAGRNRTLNVYRTNARTRGLSWELSDDDFDRLTSQDCFYCGGPPSNVARGKNQSGDFTYNGIDRVHNDLGYTLDNVVTSCRICNAAKRNLSYDEFTAWLGRLTAHQWINPQQLPTRLLRGAAA